MNRVRKIAFEEHYTAPGFAEYSARRSSSTSARPGRRPRRTADRLRRHPAARDGCGRHRLRHPVADGPRGAGRDGSGGGRATCPGEQRLPRRAGRAASDPLRRLRALGDARSGAGGRRTRARRRAARLQGGAGQRPHPRHLLRRHRLRPLLGAHAGTRRAALPASDRSRMSCRRPTRGHPELVGATWGWGVETATHALRLLFGGVFDRFPGSP